MEQNAQKEREKILEIKNLCMEFPAGKKKTVKALNNVTSIFIRAKTSAWWARAAAEKRPWAVL